MNTGNLRTKTKIIDLKHARKYSQSLRLLYHIAKTFWSIEYIKLCPTTSTIDIDHGALKVALYDFCVDDTRNAPLIDSKATEIREDRPSR